MTDKDYQEEVEDQDEQDDDVQEERPSRRPSRDRGERSNRDSGRDSGRQAMGRRKSRRRGKTYYCPKGRCFDYKDLDTIYRFISESGKIKPRRQTGNCSRCQRELAREIKRARHLALLPFVDRD